VRFFIYNSPAFKAHLEGSSHERGEVKFLQLIAAEGMNAIDIGVDVGVTTVTIAKAVGERGKVYTFDPVSGHIDTLRRNLAANGLENVSIFQMAVSDKVGTIDFYGGSIIPKEDVEKSSAWTTNLDTFLTEEKVERIDLINMDCEGSELLVLKGAEETLKENKVKIFCEIHHGFLEQLGQSIQDIVKYLQSLEFQVYSVSLHDLSLGKEFDKPEYIYAHN
jgi:FkbM family methyltransferase